MSPMPAKAGRRYSQTSATSASDPAPRRSSRTCPRRRISCGSPELFAGEPGSETVEPPLAASARCLKPCQLLAQEVDRAGHEDDVVRACRRARPRRWEELL